MRDGSIFDGCLERDADHVVETRLTLLRRAALAREQVVADREERERLHMRLGRERVERRRLHLDAEDAVFPELIVVDVLIIEAVDGDDIADRCLELQAARVGNGFFQQREIRDGAEVDRAAEDVADEARVRARGLRDEYIAQLHIRMHAAAGADAEELLAAIGVDELMHIDGDGRYAHARSLDRDRHTLVSAGVAEDIADVRVFFGVIEEMLRDEFRAQRIAWEQDALGNLALFSGNMGSTHGSSLLSAK